MFRLLLALGIVALVAAGFMTVTGSGRAVNSVLTTVLTAGHGPARDAPRPAAAAAAGPRAPGPVVATIEIRDYTFAPAELAVPAGSTVAVDNQDATIQILAAADGSFGTGEIPARQSGTFTAPMTPGTYAFRSGVLYFMSGTLVVR